MSPQKNSNGQVTSEALKWIINTVTALSAFALALLFNQVSTKVDTIDINSQTTREEVIELRVKQSQTALDLIELKQDIKELRKDLERSRRNEPND